VPSSPRAAPGLRALLRSARPVASESRRRMTALQPRRHVPARNRLPGLRCHAPSEGALRSVRRGAPGAAGGGALPSQPVVTEDGLRYEDLRENRRSRGTPGRTIRGATRDRYYRARRDWATHTERLPNPSVPRGDSPRDADRAFRRPLQCARAAGP